MARVNTIRYLEAERVWLASAKPDWTCEIIIGGDAAGPAPARLALLERVLPVLGEIERRARDHLDAFVDRGRFAGGEDWYLEGLDMGRDSAAPVSEFIMQFSLDADIYGFWTVTLREQDTGIYAVAFGRRQW